MANQSVLELAVGTGKWDAGLKKAKSALDNFTQANGGLQQALDKESQKMQKFVQMMGGMESTAKTAKGQMNDYKSTIEQLTMQYNRMTEAQKKVIGQDYLQAIEQMKQKYQNVTIAVDKDRCNGIEMLMNNNVAKDIEVVLLDDAFQHRYVKPGINILLVDYHRLIIYDTLLPAGRLREPLSGKNRADIVIITKCPSSLKPMDFRVITKAMNLFPYQQLYFTRIEYSNLTPIYCGEERPLSSIGKDENILLLTGIASPKQMIIDLEPYSNNITPMTFDDHHAFTAKDIELINNTFAEMPSPKIIITTEKDATRIFGQQGLSDEVRHNIYSLPIKVKFMQEQEESFNENIIGYVRKNSRNSILAKAKDEHKSKDSDNTGNRTGTISFRNN